MAQDRLTEKEFIARPRHRDAPLSRRSTASELIAPALAAFGAPAILKTRRFGYDGKGQAMVRDGARCAAAFGELGGQCRASWKRFVPFEREISALVARGATAASRAYDVRENTHRDHILRRSRVPADCPTGDRARRAATSPRTHRRRARLCRRAGGRDVRGRGRRAAERADGQRDRAARAQFRPLDHRRRGGIQFEQHIRAVAGWPLGSTARRGRIEMANLIGDEAPTGATCSPSPAPPAPLRQGEVRAGRKMGHVTRVYPET